MFSYCQVSEKFIGTRKVVHLVYEVKFFRFLTWLSGMEDERDSELGVVLIII